MDKVLGFGREFFEILSTNHGIRQTDRIDPDSHYSIIILAKLCLEPRMHDLAYLASVEAKSLFRKTRPICEDERGINEILEETDPVLENVGDAMGIWTSMGLLDSPSPGRSSTKRSKKFPLVPKAQV